MKRILVTGAAGFIGFHAALKLHKRGDHVVGLDHFNTYYDPLLKEERARLLKEQGVEVIRGEAGDGELIRSLFDQHRFTHVLHLAAQAGVRYARNHPMAYVDANLVSWVALLEVLKSRPETKFIYASSSSVYGLNKKIPFSEKDPTDHPANLYAATKKAGELLAFSYHHLYGIACTGLRFFTVYGPWGRPDMACYLFTEALAQGKPITLFSQGKMERDFTYIDDIVEGTVAAVDQGAAWEIFNLGNHAPCSLFKLVSLLEKQMGKKAELILVDESPGEVEKTYADIAHAQKVLGFAPKTSLEEGLSLFVQWYKSFKGIR